MPAVSSKVFAVLAEGTHAISVCQLCLFYRHNSLVFLLQEEHDDLQDRFEEEMEALEKKYRKLQGACTFVRGSADAGVTGGTRAGGCEGLGSGPLSEQQQCKVNCWSPGMRDHA